MTKYDNLILNQLHAESKLEDTGGASWNFVCTGLVYSRPMDNPHSISKDEDDEGVYEAGWCRCKG